MTEVGNGYDGFFTAGFTHRAHTEERCRVTDTDIALTRKTSYLTLSGPLRFADGFRLWTFKQI